jgi:uncharacterized 2Fe-2S/4Fe-4S cluster protein (DUF4445 family)
VIIAASKVFADIRIIMPNKLQYTVNFQPIGRRVSVSSSQSLLNAAQTAGINIASICGGVGNCNSCKIRLISGNLTAPTLEEEAIFTMAELDSGFRLACQSSPQSDLTIEVPPESLTAPQRLQIEGQELTVRVNPAVIPISLTIPEPSITDLRSDTVRLVDSLISVGEKPPFSFSSPVLDELSSLMREFNWHTTLAMRKKAIIAVLPPNTSLLGLAVDVGTTKLAAYLCDLSTGAILAKAGAMNPQTSFGEDVISRISYCSTTPDGRKTLQRRLIEALNQLIHEICLQVDGSGRFVGPEQIVEAVVVGNTAMHHLFAGLPVHQLGIAPYVPSVGQSLEIDAERVGLSIAPGAKIYLPPNIAGYVGADHVAMLLATGIPELFKTAIALDIGTNTEISLIHAGQIICCSCASGPAFEGAHIQSGMRAAPGAIERVQVIHDELRTQTIDNVPPVGICGSGILDAIACMQQVCAIDYRGSFIPDHPLVRQNQNSRHFLLIDRSKSGTGEDLVITRKDINEIQLAKGAIRTGIEVLLDVAGIPADAIEEFIIAGAFGTYINVPSAIQLGMFPSLPLDRFHQVGNAAGAGARQMLLSMDQRSRAEDLAEHVKYIELSTYPTFTQIFSKSLFF